MFLKKIILYLRNNKINKFNLFSHFFKDKLEQKVDTKQFQVKVIFYLYLFSFHV